MSISEPAVVPTAANTLRPDWIKVYRPRQLKQWRTGIALIGLGLLGLLPLPKVLDWLHGGPEPDDQAVLVVFCLLLVPVGILWIGNAMRGFPRLTATAERITFETGVGSRWASWDSLEPFEVTITYVGQSKRGVLAGEAKVVGPSASKSLLHRKSLSVPDVFQTPISAVVDELNAARAHSIGTARSVTASAVAPEAHPVGLADFKLPWLTFALLAILILVFSVEKGYSNTQHELNPSVASLVAMGGLIRKAVLSDGEWYRLFTSTLLHTDILHILSNGVALLLGGRLLESLVGRLWFFAFFTIGALGGSLMSLAVGPANVVSVGASGALMGMFAALLVSSFRLPAESPGRHRLQANSLQVPIPSLVPLTSAASIGQIDYGAHFGGALSGAALAALLLGFWPQTERLPRLRSVAVAITTAGAILFVASAGIALHNYSRYDVTFIPLGEFPATAADQLAQGAALVAKYPSDPRSHLFHGQALETSGDQTGAERELRTALSEARPLSLIFGSKMELGIRARLAAFLLVENRADDAKGIAAPVCAAPAGDTDIDNLRKLLAGQHLCE